MGGRGLGFRLLDLFTVLVLGYVSLGNITFGCVGFGGFSFGGLGLGGFRLRRIGLGNFYGR